MNKDIMGSPVTIVFDSINAIGDSYQIEKSPVLRSQDIANRKKN